MHGLTGGNWKRNTRTVMVRKKNGPAGNHPASNGFTTYHRPGHRASSRPPQVRAHVGAVRTMPLHRCSGSSFEGFRTRRPAAGTDT